MKKFKHFKLIVLALVLSGGLYYSDLLFLQKRQVASLEGTIRSAVSGDRNFDLTELSSKDFMRGFKVAMVSGLQVVRDGHEVGLTWGQFLVRNQSGAKVYVCEKYPHLEMTLKAEGVAYSGNIPTIVLRGPCLSSDDGQRTRPLMIPLRGLHRLLRENPKNIIKMGDRGDTYSIEAQSLYDEWPQYWTVVGASFSNDIETLGLDGFELISLLDQVLTLDFAEPQ
ncbi:MAG: hypothetical protein IPM97_12185 [Bdellovibrionaceae bacterium]|nr:hypothetical protein [Pseudobdellovibrionaceae bacterium]